MTQMLFYKEKKVINASVIYNLMPWTVLVSTKAYLGVISSLNMDKNRTGFFP